MTLIASFRIFRFLTSILGLYCRGTWDGWLCWPDTEAGKSALQPCPAFMDAFDPTSKKSFLMFCGRVGGNPYEFVFSIVQQDLHTKIAMHTGSGSGIRWPTKPGPTTQPASIWIISRWVMRCSFPRYQLDLPLCVQLWFISNRKFPYMSVPVPVDGTSENHIRNGILDFADSPHLIAWYFKLL